MVRPQTLNYDDRGLIPAVVQHCDSREILMVAWMNAESLALTQSTRLAHFWSRSRKKLWLKGETSGNYLQIVEVLVDCDADTLLLKVFPKGPTCHTGANSCFFQTLENTYVSTTL